MTSGTGRDSGRIYTKQPENEDFLIKESRIVLVRIRESLRWASLEWKGFSLLQYTKLHVCTCSWLLKPSRAVMWVKLSRLVPNRNHPWRGRLRLLKEQIPWSFNSYRLPVIGSQFCRNSISRFWRDSILRGFVLAILTSKHKNRELNFMI